MSTLSDELAIVAALPTDRLAAFRLALHNYRWNQACAVRTSLHLDDTDTYNQRAGAPKTIAALGDFVGSTTVPMISSANYSDAGEFLTEIILQRLVGAGPTSFKMLVAKYLYYSIIQEYEEAPAIKYALADLYANPSPLAATDFADPVEELLAEAATILPLFLYTGLS